MTANAARYGISTPSLILHPERRSAWENDARFEDIAEIVKAADKLGYDHVTCSEHVGIPTDIEPVRGGRYYDPLSTFGYFAAVTERIRFCTYVLVLGYNHPLAIAKRYGTLDHISNGRVILGVGVGSLQPEFELLGADFEKRGAKGDDALRALRASLGQRTPEYHGEHYDFSGFFVDPCAKQKDMPIWIGGRGPRSLKRAVELGDGWAPFGLSVAELGAAVAKAKEFPSWHARKKPLDLVWRHEGFLDPAGKPDDAAEKVRAVLNAGGTYVHINFEHRSKAHYVEQLEALAALRV
jgi:probable F420-dependent oxidoreductase